MKGKHVQQMMQALMGLAMACCCSMAALADVAVMDYLGREVRLAQPAQRIVALAPHIVENLFSAGAGGRIKGVVDHCDYPAAAAELPRVGAISSYSLEAILALQPDLVVVWHSGRGGDILKRLDALGIPSYASEPVRLEDVARSVRDFGTLAGTSAVAGKAAARFERDLARLRQRFQDRAPVPALYQVWHEPLQTLNDRHIISDVMRLCGGRNVFGDAPALAPRISVESVIDRDPLAIIASGMGEARPDWLDRWRRWPVLRAVQQDNLFFIPPDIIQRHTVRMLKGAQMMCEHLDTARGRVTRATE